MGESTDQAESWIDRSGAAPRQGVAALFWSHPKGASGMVGTHAYSGGSEMPTVL